MLSNVDRIIQKMAKTPTLGVCLSILNFFLFFLPTSTPSSTVQRANCYPYPFFKDAYGKHLLFATLGSYVACLWDIKVIPVSVENPFRRIFGGGGAETKTGLGLSTDIHRYPQISTDIHRYEKCVMMWM